MLKVVDFRMTQKETKALKGLLALLVVLCHLRSYIAAVAQNEILGPLFIAFGYVSVAFFFFLSGYGLHRQYLTKPNYMAHFLRNRVVTTYVKYAVVALGYVALFFVAGLINPTLWVKTFLWGGTVVVNGWYFQATLLVYILFFLAYGNRSSDRTKIVFLCVGMVVYGAVCKLFQLESHWYQTVLCFLLGAIWSIWQQKGIFRFFRNPFVIAGELLCGIILVILKSSVPLHEVTQIFVTTVLSMLFILPVICSGGIKYITNSVFLFFGEISFEIYGIHGAVLTLLRSKLLWISNDALLTVLLFVITIPCAWVLHKIFALIDKKIKV